MTITRLSLVTLLLSAGATTAFAQTATQTVNLNVQAISVLAMSGAPSLTVNAAVAGAANATPATAAGTYAITNNQTLRKITASIDANMPGGMTFTAALVSPGSGTTSGAQVLSTAAADVVTTMGAVSAAGIAVNYSLTVAAATAPVSLTRIVTLTITAG